MPSKSEETQDKIDRVGKSLAIATKNAYNSKDEPRPQYIKQAETLKEELDALIKLRGEQISVETASLKASRLGAPPIAPVDPDLAPAPVDPDPAPAPATPVIPAAPAAPATPVDLQKNKAAADAMGRTFVG